MSVIAYYAHLSAASLDHCRSNDNWLGDLYSRKIPESEVIDIDKACEGIVWILSRLPVAPSSNLAGAGFVMERSLASSLRGGTIERRLDASLGPASSLSKDDVSELNSWLQAVTPDQMRAKYDPTEMEGDSVYPDIWMEEGEAALNEYLLPYFQKLQQFFARAADAKHVVIVFFE